MPIKVTVLRSKYDISWFSLKLAFCLLTTDSVTCRKVFDHNWNIIQPCYAVTINEPFIYWGRSSVLWVAFWPECPVILQYMSW
jgi:hypothetical protein